MHKKFFLQKLFEKRHPETIITQAVADEKTLQTAILPFVDNCLQAQIIMCEGKSSERIGGMSI
jgi:hypothetical protein